MPAFFQSTSRHSTPNHGSMTSPPRGVCEETGGGRGGRFKALFALQCRFVTKSTEFVLFCGVIEEGRYSSRPKIGATTKRGPAYIHRRVVWPVTGIDCRPRACPGAQADAIQASLRKKKRVDGEYVALTWTEMVCASVREYLSPPGPDPPPPCPWPPSSLCRTMAFMT